MSDPVTLFPNVLQPAATLKTYAPMGVKFWQGEEALLDGMREFTEGWFARRNAGTRAALEAAKRIGDSATPLDAMREYQDWFSGAIGRVVEDGLALQQHALKAGARLGAKPVVEAAAKAQEELSGERRAG